MTTRLREHLPNRRASESFTFELGGLRFTATISRFPDGCIGELFLNNHKAGNQSDTNARDAAIVLSFALQYGANIDEIRKALCRDSQGRALGPLGAALDVTAGQDRGHATAPRDVSNETGGKKTNSKSNDVDDPGVANATAEQDRGLP